jgi:hypothetical protein
MYQGVSVEGVPISTLGDSAKAQLHCFPYACNTSATNMQLLLTSEALVMGPAYSKLILRSYMCSTTVQMAALTTMGPAAQPQQQGAQQQQQQQH